MPQSTFDAVGVGTAALFPSKASPPGTPSSDKPLVLYYGAEFCPFCAAERWPAAVALSRFGTWNDLGVTTSSATDQFPGTPTLSFHGATLTSSTLTFHGYETTTNQPLAGGGGYEPLDTVPAADLQIITALNPSGGIPFMSFDAQYQQSGASYSPQILAGKTQEEIAAAPQTRRIRSRRRLSAPPTCSRPRSARPPTSSRPTSVRLPASWPAPRSLGS